MDQVEKAWIDRHGLVELAGCKYLLGNTVEAAGISARMVACVVDLVGSLQYATPIQRSEKHSAAKQWLMWSSDCKTDPIHCGVVKSRSSHGGLITKLLRISPHGTLHYRYAQVGRACVMAYNNIQEELDAETRQLDGDVTFEPHSRLTRDVEHVNQRTGHRDHCVSAGRNP